MDLISRQEAIDTLAEWHDDAITNRLNNLSSVDAVPVRHGRWITHELQINGYAHATCECTACGSSRPTTLFPLNYCPNCGAKMDGKDGEQENK